jgi:hypothetical protein
VLRNADGRCLLHPRFGQTSPHRCRRYRRIGIAPRVRPRATSGTTTRFVRSCRITGVALDHGV